MENNHVRKLFFWGFFFFQNIVLFLQILYAQEQKCHFKLLVSPVSKLNLERSLLYIISLKSSEFWTTKSTCLKGTTLLH